MQAGLRAWTQVLLGQADDKAEVDMDTDAPQVSHKPGGEPKIKVSFPVGLFLFCVLLVFLCFVFFVVVVIFSFFSLDLVGWFFPYCQLTKA